MSLPHDVIVAVASAPGGAARAILRVSGEGALECVAACTFAGQSPLTSLHRAQVVAAWMPIPRDPNAQPRGETADCASDLEAANATTQPTVELPCDLYVWPTQRSFTRQPMVEIHMFGSPPLVEAVLRQLCQAGARLAQPGEFTLRAFLAGRIDLPQAEAVLGVIDASSDLQLKTALDQLAGGLSQPLNRLREGILDMVAEVEAGLDFVDEDITFISNRQLAEQCAPLIGELDQLIGQLAHRSIPVDLPRVVLFGSTNVGKSSLLNALVGEQRAMVSEIPGTTRDYVQIRTRVEGVACDLIDTAGIDAALSRAEIDAWSQQAAERQQASADLELLCLDASRSLTDWEQTHLNRPAPRGRLLVLTKTDLPRRLPPQADEICTSSVTGAGLDTLRERLRRCLAAHSGEGNAVASTSQRCRQSLVQARDALQRAQDLAHGEESEELIACELRLALTELGKVVGTVYTDDILDRIFSRFCIGK